MTHIYTPQYIYILWGRQYIFIYCGGFYNIYIYICTYIYVDVGLSGKGGGKGTLNVNIYKGQYVAKHILNKIIYFWFK